MLLRNVTKIVEGGVTEVYVGDSIVYVITVTNNGNSTATGVNVTEKLSDLVVVTGAVADVGSWNNDTKVWTIPSLAGKGAKAILTLTVKVVNNGTVAKVMVLLLMLLWLILLRILLMFLLIVLM